MMRNVLVLTLTVATVASADATAQQPPVFGAAVESVYVDVFVSRGGKPVEGLAASHFRVKDNGRPVTVELLSAEALPLTALLVFDTSESVRGATLEALKAAARAFIGGLRAKDEVGLVAFSHEIRRLARPTTDKAKVVAALDRLEAEGPTAVWDALSAAMNVLPPTSRSLVVVFSDGADNKSWLDGERVYAQARRSNALVQVVGPSSTVRSVRPVFGFGTRGLATEVPESLYVADLRRVAELTGGRFWSADSPDRLAEAFRAIIEAMNSRYVLRFDPGPDAKPGWHGIEIKLEGAKGDVRARQGYWRARPAR
jgi:VWFA-related protein